MNYKAEELNNSREAREQFQKDWEESTGKEITVLNFGTVIQEIEDKLIDFNYDDDMADAEIEALEENEEPYKRNGHYYLNYLGAEMTVYFVERFEGSSSTLYFTEIEF